MESDPSIDLVESDSGEVTLLIDGEQAMQAWERPLMWEMADMLCQYGSEFLEAGLGLGLSALRIAENPGTRRHVVVEKHESRVGSWRGGHRLRFQLPPVKPCMWFSHTRLSDIVHRQACAVR
ncbi:MAG: hypothetical protein M3460_07870, partial [Actinomycetota bacterium]|nr:hypothetical protein [Actinomycetota bacterium]